MNAYKVIKADVIHGNDLAIFQLHHSAHGMSELLITGGNRVEYTSKNPRKLLSLKGRLVNSFNASAVEAGDEISIEHNHGEAAYDTFRIGHHSNENEETERKAKLEAEAHKRIQHQTAELEEIRQHASGRPEFAEYLQRKERGENVNALPMYWRYEKASALFSGRVFWSEKIFKGKDGYTGIMMIDVSQIEGKRELRWFDVAEYDQLLTKALQWEYLPVGMHIEISKAGKPKTRSAADSELNCAADPT